MSACPGMGLQATIGDRRVVTGNSRLMQAEGIAVDEEVREILGRLALSGRTPTYVAVNGGFAGAIAAADRPRPNSARAVRDLRELVLEVVMISGDTAPTARSVAAEIDRCRPG